MFASQAIIQGLLVLATRLHTTLRASCLAFHPSLCQKQRRSVHPLGILSTSLPRLHCPPGLPRCHHSHEPPKQGDPPLLCAPKKYRLDELVLETNCQKNYRRVVGFGELIIPVNFVSHRNTSQDVVCCCVLLCVVVCCVLWLLLCCCCCVVVAVLVVRVVVDVVVLWCLVCMLLLLLLLMLLLCLMCMFCCSRCLFNIVWMCTTMEDDAADEHECTWAEHLRVRLASPPNPRSIQKKCFFWIELQITG